MTRSSNLNTAGSTGVFRGRNQSGTSNRRSLNLILIIAVLAAMLAANFRPVFAMSDGDGTPIYEPTTNNVTGWPEKQPIYGQSCVLMDLETGAVLCSLERETTRYPASTTKVMTCLLGKCCGLTFAEHCVTIRSALSDANRAEIAALAKELA